MLALSRRSRRCRADDVRRPKRRSGSSKRRTCRATRSRLWPAGTGSPPTSSSPGEGSWPRARWPPPAPAEEVVPASEYRAAHQQIRELQRLLGKKTLKNEILREAVERVTAPKKLPLRVSSWPEGGR